jgi:hypothetical protein
VTSKRCFEFVGPPTPADPAAFEDLFDGSEFLLAQCGLKDVDYPGTNLRSRSCS